MKIIKLLCAVLLSCTFSTVFADDTTVSIKDKDGNDLTVAPGETVDMYLFIDYSNETIEPGDFGDDVIPGSVGLLQSIQLKMQLPDGFDYVGAPVFVDGVCNYPSTVKYDTSGGPGVYFITNPDHSDEAVLYITKGALLKIQIKATSAAVSEDPYVGQITHFHIPDGEYTNHFGVNSKKPALYPAIPFNIYVKEAAPATSVDIELANEWNTYCYGGHTLDFTDVSGAEAYAVSEVTATSAKLTRIYKIPGGQGFLIKGTAGSKITVPFTTDDADPGTNLLVGVTEATSLAADNFILVDGKFVKSNGEGQLGANKAYLPASKVPAEAKSIILDFGSDATGINEIQKAETEGAIYNLSGMRVSKTQKGVYIMNGRKVIVK